MLNKDLKVMLCTELVEQVNLGAVLAVSVSGGKAQPTETPPTVVEPTPAPILVPEPQTELEQQAQPNYEFPSQKVNELARKKFQEHLLKEILFDLTVCELEGWNKLDYIKELKRLINGVAAANVPKGKPQAQLDFFTQNNP
jgi:hypothetical protein